jgi:hypothetical protein
VYEDRRITYLAESLARRPTIYLVCREVQDDGVRMTLIDLADSFLAIRSGEDGKAPTLENPL